MYSSHGFQPVEGERRTTLVSLSPSPFEGRLNGVQAPRRGLNRRKREGGAGNRPRVETVVFTHIFLENVLDRTVPFKAHFMGLCPA